MSVDDSNANEPLIEPLTRREREVLGLLAQGYSAPEIAQSLTLAVSSVKSHIQNLYGKLGVNNKRAALNRAQALGLLHSAAGPTALVSSSAEDEAAPEPGEPPFKGLLYFDERDAALFFGREALAAKLAARLSAGRGPGGPGPTRFLAVVGASGSGKSSIVRAGVIPALKLTENPARRFARIQLMTPTAKPLEALAVSLSLPSDPVSATTALMDELARDERTLHVHARRLFAGHEPADRRMLLVVDQFEEVFTLCHSPAERQAFIANLVWATAPENDGPTTVVITLRADFYAHCAPYAGLREALAKQQEYIGPMGAEELREVVERPARAGGWTLAPGLANLILRDVGDEPGALPLLSHALLETWRHRRGRTLTVDSYEEAGRVQGAIAMTAEAVFQILTPDEQVIARSIFLRLTALGEGTQDTRRRADMAELLPAGAAAADAAGGMAKVLKTLSDARLIIQDGDSVEVAHEALIREWPTLQQWLSEDREGLRLHRRLTEAAQEWDLLERDPSELYRGPRLAQALEWAQFSRRASDLNAIEREFVEASRAFAEREAAEREAQRQNELEAARGLAEAQRQRAEVEARRASEQAQAAGRLRTGNRVITGIAALALLAVIAAVFYNLQSNRNELAAQAASTQSIARGQEADRQAQLAAAYQLASQSTFAMDRNLPVGLLLGAEAFRLAPDPQTRANLGRVFRYSPHLLGLRWGHSAFVTSVAFSADSQRLASGSRDATVRLWDMASRQLSGAPLSDVTGAINGVAFSSDGLTLAAAGRAGSLYLWDAASGQLRSHSPATSNDEIRSLAFSPDGKTVATGTAHRMIQLWEAATGQPMGQPLVGHTDYVTGVAFSPDGKYLASNSPDGTARLWDLATGQQMGQPLRGDKATQMKTSAGIGYSPDGRTLATANADEILLWDVAAIQRTISETTAPAPIARLRGHTDAVTSLAFSPDGKVLASGSADHTLLLWDLASRLPLGPALAGHTLPVTSVAFSPDGKRLASGSAENSVGIWQLSDSLLDMASQDWLSRACDLAGRNLTRDEWNTYFAPQPYRKICAQWPEGL